jgi:alpha-tubulin suppressor-like RCC1 family protein
MPILIQMISGGYYHSLFLNDEGQVFGYGDNRDNQITIPNNMGKIIQISAGDSKDLSVLRCYNIAFCFAKHKNKLNNLFLFDSHSLFLNEDGQVFGCGFNNPNQITIPNNIGRITQISAGGEHCLLLNEEGQVFGYGDNEYEQLNFPPDLILTSEDWVLK